MSKESDKISRRELLGTLAKVGAGLAFVDTTDISQAAPNQVGTPSPVNASTPPNLRQQDSISIRTAAAQSGALPPSGFQPVNDDGLLRAREFSKILRRAMPTRSGPIIYPPPLPFDPALPDQTGFTAYKNALDAAYSRTFSGAGLTAAPDTVAIENLEQYIGGDTKFRFTNPLGGLAFELEGTDPASVAIMAPPDFSSAETAAEMAELYWMALLRDTPLNLLNNDTSNLSIDSTIDDAIADLNKFSWFRDYSPITRKRFLRARLRPNTYANQDGALGFEGVDVGPYLSQFLLRGTQDGTISGPETGIVNFGALRLSLRQRTVLPGIDYLTELGTLPSSDSPEQFLAVQNGSRLNIGQDAVDDSGLYFIRTLRDGANYVHFDEIYQEYLIAASILLSSVPRVGNTRPAASGNRKASAKASATVASTTSTTGDEVPEPYTAEGGGLIGSFLNYGNPYRFNVAQVGFATFGVTQTLALLAEVSNRAHKAGWYQKWGIRRIRPEEYGARVNYSVNLQNSDPLGGTNPYDLHPDILTADGEDGRSNILNLINEQNDGESYLLPIAFPEGCPTHPAYPSGHATVAGASVTVLKALFDESALLTNGTFPNGATEPPPYIVNRDGASLSMFGSRSSRVATLTIGGELNKLVSNILYFRGFAGMHWRSDSVEGALVGERVAVELLLEQTFPSASGTKFYRERWISSGVAGDDQANQPQSPFFRFTLFSGQAIDIQDGQIFLVDRSAHPGNQSQWVRTSQAYSSYSSFQEAVYNMRAN